MDIERLVRESFGRQTIMATLGATLESVSEGRVTITLPYAAHICQQHGFLHAGVVSTIADSACGYAGLTVMPQGSAVLTVEFKINLLAPARGERFVAEGCVVKAGRTLVVTQGEVTALDTDRRVTVAVITATLMRLPAQPGMTA